MTYPIYSQTTLEAMTVAELKTIASQLGAIPDGDKRVKQTWVSAVLDHQIKFSPAKVAAMEAHIERAIARMESVTPATSELPTIDSYIPSPRTHISETTLDYVDHLGKLYNRCLMVADDLPCGSEFEPADRRAVATTIFLQTCHKFDL
jgi:hypothetical protein